MQTLNRLKSKRPRRAYDFYETPIELCDASWKRLHNDEDQLFIDSGIDAGCGRGVWGKSLLYEIYEPAWDKDGLGYSGGYAPDLIGIDTQEFKHNYCYRNWYQENFLDFTCLNKQDIVFGNPPYSLAEEFVRHSMTLVSDGGYVYFLLRLAFLESKKRYFGLFSEYQPKRVYVLSRRPSFFGVDGKGRTTDAIAYAMFLWQKGWTGDTVLDWLYWEYDK